MTGRNTGPAWRLAVVAILAVGLGARAEDLGVQRRTTLKPGGTSTLPAPGTSTGTITDGRADLLAFPTPDLDGLLAEVGGDSGSGKAAAVPLAVPEVKNSKIAFLNPGFSGFDGLNHADQRTAGTGPYVNSQFNLEPPDQALCVGHGYVVESVNLAVRVYRPDGTPATDPIALNQFFGLKPAIDRVNGVYGDFLSDPRCHFDADTQRFFLIVLQLGLDAATGAFNGPSALYIAVSKTPDPTGGWNIFSLDTTSDAAGGTQPCPCFGDQPLLGFDVNGMFVSNNVYSNVSGRYSGASIYAFSKYWLAAGLPPPFVLNVGLPVTNSDGGLNFSIQPATRARGDEFREFGREFFMSQFNLAALENQLQVFSLGDTTLLHFPPGPSTTFRFQRVAIPSETYGVPPDALQKIGPRYLADVLLKTTIRNSLATNEQRMQQVTYADGKLWGAVTTVLHSSQDTKPAGAFGDPNKAGVAWFSVDVRAHRDLRAEVADQGYVAVKNTNAFFPALGVTSDGRAAIGFSLSGPDLYPSTGYVQKKGRRFGKVHFAGIGPASADGDTAYPQLDPGAPCDDPTNPKECEERWGDYGAAAVGPDGSIWLANEYVSPRPRTAAANWGTFVTRLQPRWDDDDDERD